MDNYHHLMMMILTALLPAFLVFLLFKKSHSLGNTNNLPPGPPGHPVVGNLFQVARSGKQFFEYVRDLVPIYGPILTLRMGARTMIIVSDADLAHEALVEKGPVFASRPKENPTRAIFSSNKFTVNAAVHGPVWRSLRRNMVQNMLSAARVKEFQGVRRAAMDTFIRRLRAEADANQGSVWVLRNARFAVFCILLAMCFGDEVLDDDTIERVDDTMRQVLAVLKPRLDDYFPLLGIFFPKQRSRVREVRRKQVDTLAPLIEKRRRLRNNNKNGFSYLDTLFDLKIEGRDSSPTVPELVTLCSEFLNGGTDTTATAIEWAAARIIENPGIQSRLHDEIRLTVGDERAVDEKDVEKMPYLNAVVKELLRKHPPTYFLLTHAVTEPAVKLAGYDIPPGANVEFFSQGISEDPKVWSDPERFDPDRFFEGREDADVTGTTGVKMMPFGAGRRICPGLGMGTVHISLMLARMVQEFEWSAHPDDDGKLDFSETLIFTVVMKNSLRAKIKPRA